MALNYMWVVSTGRKSSQWMRERLSRSCGRVVSKIGERGRDRDDRQATRSATATTPPSYTSPHSSAILPGLTGPVDREGEVEALCSISLGNDVVVHLMKLLLAFKSKASYKKKEEKRNRYNASPFHFCFLSDDFCVLSHGQCTHSLVVFSQVTLGNMMDFPVCCRFIACKTQ